MDFILFCVFVMVVCEGNLMCVVVQLYLMQLVVSLQIKYLQEMFGVVLFMCMLCGFVFMCDGQMLLLYVEWVLVVVVDVQCVVVVLWYEVCGWLWIGMIFDLGFLWFGGFLCVLVEIYLQIEIVLWYGMLGWVIEQVWVWVFDVGYYIGCFEEDLLCDEVLFYIVMLMCFEYCVLVFVGWKECVQCVYDWWVFVVLLWIWMLLVFVYYWLLLWCFVDVGVQLVKVVEVDQEQLMFDFVKLGIGLMFVCDLIVLVEVYVYVLMIVEYVMVLIELMFVMFVEWCDELVIVVVLWLIEVQWVI